MKRIVCFFVVLVCVLGVFPIMASATETLPTVTVVADKTDVKAGETVTLTMKMDKDVEETVTFWQWNFVWDSTCFEPVEASVGDAVVSNAVQPIVNYQNPTMQMAAPYQCATVTSGNGIVPHNLKAGVIATLTLRAKQDVSEDMIARFYIDDIAVLDSTGTVLNVTVSDSAVEWGSDPDVVPAESVGLSIEIKPASSGDDPGTDTHKHEDNNKDHTCDNGCTEKLGEHKDENKDHICDYGCAEKLGEHKDENKDHICDYGCAEKLGEHKDENKDHACDYGCTVKIGECIDSQDDDDEVCDYGCGKEYTTDKLSGGTIATIVIVSIAVLGALAFGMFRFAKKRKV